MTIEADLLEQACEDRDVYLKNLTETQLRCTELTNDKRALETLNFELVDALIEIAKCNDGKGEMPERAQRALGYAYVKRGCL